MNAKSKPVLEIEPIIRCRQKVQTVSKPFPQTLKKYFIMLRLLLVVKAVSTIAHSIPALVAECKSKDIRYPESCINPSLI